MGSVLTIGVFDGVHRGHQRLVAETVARARGRGLRAVVVTFDPNPIEVLRPEQAPKRLCSLTRRVEYLQALGVDHVEVLPFDARMAAMPASDFAREILRERLSGQQVVVGAGFRFGHRAAGDATVMRDTGLEVLEFSLVPEAGESVSSSRIREAVALGHMELAASMLGRWHSVVGPVSVGFGRGRALGYPTANVDLGPRTAIPADGVYAGMAHWADGNRVAAISVGSNPTFGAGERTVEAYLLDFDADLYGVELEVAFAHRLRPMVAFDSSEDLMEGMAQDVRRTADLMSS